MFRVLLYLLLAIFYCTTTFAQITTNRYGDIEKKLHDLATSTVPSLNDPIDFSVSGVSIQEFLRGIALAHELNISVDPALDFKVYNNFTKEKVLNVLVFLVKEYDLDIRFSGSIMSFVKYVPPVATGSVYVPKNIQIKFSSYSNLITLDLQNDSLVLVAKKITQVTKKNVIVTSALQSKIVSGYIEDMPFEAALSKLALINDIKFVKTDDQFFIFKSNQEAETVVDNIQNSNLFKSSYNTVASGNTANVPMNTSSNAVIRCTVSDTTANAKIHLEAINAPVSDVIKIVSAKANKNFFIYSEIKGNCNNFVSGLNYDELLLFLLQSTNYTYKKEGGLYLIGDRTIEGLRTYKVVQLKHRALDNILDVIPQEIRKDVEVKEFKELNSLLLAGSLPQILEIEAFISEVDKVVPVVMIEVIIMEVNKSRTVKTGITAGLSDSVVSNKGTILSGTNVTVGSSTINDFISGLGIGGVTNLGNVSPNFYVTLSALETNKNIEVRSMPKLSTLNGHEAVMTIGQTVYYSIETQNTTGSLTPNTIRTTQYQSVQANQTLNIKPLVSGDDQVTLIIEVSQSSFLPSDRATGPPNTSTSQFKSIVRVGNQEMLVLGGLEKMSKSTDVSGTPFLSRIPIIKYLFSTTSKSKTKSIYVLFIKPTIIY